MCRLFLCLGVLDAAVRREGTFESVDFRRRRRGRRSGRHGLRDLSDVEGGRRGPGEESEKRMMLSVAMLSAKSPIRERRRAFRLFDPRNRVRFRAK